MLEGWIHEGEGVLRKWFGDHYKTAPNEDVAASLDQEHALHNPEPVAPEAPADAPVAEATDEAGAAPAADASETTATEEQ